MIALPIFFDKIWKNDTLSSHWWVKIEKYAETTDIYCYNR